MAKKYIKLEHYSYGKRCHVWFRPEALLSIATYEGTNTGFLYIKSDHGGSYQVLDNKENRKKLGI